MSNSESTTTTLIEIRAFLAREAPAISPWSPPVSAVESLYELLRSRRHDPEFWDRLEQLAVRLEDRRFVPSRLPGGDALGPAIAENLLEDLRASLPPVNGVPHPLRDWIRTRVGATAIAGFLLLGAAVGCDDGSAGGCQDEAADYGFTGEEATVYEALVDAVDGSELTFAEKCTIYECVPEFDAAAREALLEQFQMLTEEELSDVLEGFVDFCDEQDNDDDDDDDDCDDGCH